MTAAIQTVREIAQTQPTSIRVFEKFGIEYCCGGGERLIEACAAKGVDVDAVIAALEAAVRSENAGGKDWTRESLENLTKHIVANHHAYCKNELPRLSGLAMKVAKVHGGTNPELALIRTRLAELAQELTDHLAEEEVVVFPMIVKLETEKINAGVEPAASIGRLAENWNRPTGACLQRVVAIWTNHLLGPKEFVEIRIGQKAQLAVGFT